MFICHYPTVSGVLCSWRVLILESFVTNLGYTFLYMCAHKHVRDTDVVIK